MTLSYDPLGRLRRTTTGGIARDFLYDGDALVAEYEGSTLVRRYVHGAGVDEPLVWYQGSTLTDRRWLIPDWQGTIVAHVNGAGATERYTYGPYGEPHDWGGQTTLSRFRYTGQAALPEVALYHYKARVYDPVLGRFLQTDPVGYQDDLNLYAYLRADPLNSIDPTGTQDCGGTRIGSEPGSICGGSGMSVEEARAVLNDPNSSIRLQQEALRVLRVELGPRLFGEFFDAVTSGLTVNAAYHCVVESQCNVIDFIPFARLGRIARLANAVCCFAAGTLVHTADGLRPIEDIRPGDFVLSRSELTGEIALRQVTSTVPAHQRELWQVEVSVQSANGLHRSIFRTTGDHPWRSVHGRWLRTDELQNGVVLVTAFGAPARVDAVFATGVVALTYNLEVDEFHTYFVGEDAVWVHNNCPPLRHMRGHQLENYSSGHSDTPWTTGVKEVRTRSWIHFAQASRTPLRCDLMERLWMVTPEYMSCENAGSTSIRFLGNPIHEVAAN